MVGCEVFGHDIEVTVVEDMVIYRHEEDRFSYPNHLTSGDENLMRVYERALEAWLNIIHAKV